MGTGRIFRKENCTCPHSSLLWWVDLDAFELANPGMILGEPLEAVVRVSDRADAGTSSSILYQVAARLQKK